MERKRISKRDYDREMQIWSLWVPVIVALISLAGSLTIAIIKTAGVRVTEQQHMSSTTEARSGASTVPKLKSTEAENDISFKDAIKNLNEKYTNIKFNTLKEIKKKEWHPETVVYPLQLEVMRFQIKLVSFMATAQFIITEGLKDLHIYIPSITLSIAVFIVMVILDRRYISYSYVVFK